ncbi:DUF4296 domain-containing protein [Flavobacteriaceae bacterium]|jgi:hypothetical protein|nr:DUF4296 domain-containing protein [Flavobacteriaceae bacterium]MDC1180592.1 DUF4296 domain-containing protein [Flavobacteriaceae bacterium]MDC1372400.1 DUF4296 domain-containing protein [Flavobacteriaceae bacterium]
MNKLQRIIILCLVFSCNNTLNQNNKPPENLISKEKMVDIIYDMTLINVAKGVNKSILENNGIIPEQYLFNKHSIDSMLFAKSNEYYSYDLKTYQTIYDNVKIKLEKNKKIIIDSIEILKQISGEMSKKLIKESKKNKILIDTIKIDSISKIKLINTN